MTNFSENIVALVDTDVSMENIDDPPSTEYSEPPAELPAIPLPTDICGIQIIDDKIFSSTEISEIISFKVTKERGCLLKVKVTEGENCTTIWIPFDNIDDKRQVIEWLTRAGLDRTCQNQTKQENFDVLVMSETEENMTGLGLIFYYCVKSDLEFLSKVEICYNRNFCEKLF